MKEVSTDKEKSVSLREKDILDFWKENRIFEKSDKKSAPKGEFIFYDGPPFATGLPHYGHILAGTIKDVIPRYKTMCGYRVSRRWGWDCHGLPLENEIEKELGLKNKRDIEKLGVEKFNEAARKAVLRYADDWRKIIPRMGRWVDMDRDYKTMDSSYTESVWWIFNALNKKGLVYEGNKSMHLCPRCGTTLSNFEVAQGYRDIVDFAVTVKLKLSGEENRFILVWTTTPWTLPGNMAVAINKDAQYVIAEKDGEELIVAKDRVGVLGDNYSIKKEITGDSLVGVSYSPPFPYYVDKKIKNKDNAWKIYHASYVSLEDGTGAVHIAPAFGAEDMELSLKCDIPLIHHVTEDGVFSSDVTDFAGMPVKPKDTEEEKDKHQSADIEIIKYLAHKELLFKKEKITHSYPHCWRCFTPLLNYASSSWFVKVSSFREKLVSENEKIKWVPRDIGEKRFGNWLKGARDWAVSRSRYWGAPIPVWKNKETGSTVFIESLDELKKYTKKSGNKYLLMRHGEALFNTKNTLNAELSVENPLTKTGKDTVRAVAKKLEGKKIDMVVYSPLQRTRETAEALVGLLGLSKDILKEDSRLKEVTFGEFEGKSINEYHSFFQFTHERMIVRPKGGETWTEVKSRVMEVLYEFDEKYKDKTILIVSHNGPIQMMQAGAYGYDISKSGEHIENNQFDLKTGEIRELSFVPIPHSTNYELDLHRPYIDEIDLVDTNGAPLKRVPYVFDCWFESGSMPYGQQHYPFENTDIFDPTSSWFKRSRGYPADFIAEGMDQTRGWFYSLIIIGTALFGKSPYRNVIVNGLVLTEDGTKMSKSLKNYPDPMDVIENYGADSLRYYLLSSPIVRGEDFAFSNKGVAEVMRKNIGRLSNVLSFYKIYADPSVTGKADSPNRLDQWIVARLNELIGDVTLGMERYELDKGTRPISFFIDDLSTWYLRRSRERFKGENEKDKKYALSTLRHVFVELSKVMAPSMPFFSEYLYLATKEESSPESVHLCKWPIEKKVNKVLLKEMAEARSLVSLGLEARDKVQIKVRQPLSLLTVKKLSINSLDIPLVKEEINIKEIVEDKNIENEIVLDTLLTEELKDEGIARDFIRQVQVLRKAKGLTTEDTIELIVDTQTGKALIERFQKEIQSKVLAKEIIFKETEGENVVLADHTFKISLEKCSKCSC